MRYILLLNILLNIPEIVFYKKLDIKKLASVSSGTCLCLTWQQSFKKHTYVFIVFHFPKIKGLHSVVPILVGSILGTAVSRKKL